MQAMNHHGNFGNQRGFGGPPQPQRLGRRGVMNRGGGGGFRNSRFDNNMPRNQNQNQSNQGGQPVGQRPNNNETKPIQTNEKSLQNQQQQPQQKEQQKQPVKPESPAQQNVQSQNAQQQQKSVQNTPKSVPKPAPQPTKVESQDKVDNSVNNVNNSEQRNQNTTNNQNQQQRNVESLFGGNRPGVWSQGGQGGQGGRGNQNAQSGQGGQGGQSGQGGQGGQSGFGGQGNQSGFGGQGNQSGFGGQGGQGGNRPSGNFGGQGNNKQFNQRPGGGPVRNQRNMRGPMDQSGKPPAQREEQMLANKLKDLVGPLVDLPPLDQSEVKFNGRSRLYIGNLTGDVTEEEIQKLFEPFGETAELFVNKEKNFGFIKLDYRVNAEKAKRELDGKMRNGRTLRVRFAPHNSAVRVKNLPPFVSNELLYRAFEIFGKVERAYVKVDERGKTLGEGVVEFARKPSALAAIRNCTEKCFFLTASLRPVIVESFEEPDELDGYPEKNLPKKHPEFIKSREVGPRFSEASSFEHEYGTRWKQLHELHRQKEEALKKELAVEEEKLEAQMEYAKYEHETELLRQQLRQREQDRERQKRSWELAERAADERLESERKLLMRNEEELGARIRHQDDELRRRQQENTLFVQAQRLNTMLDRQEQGMFDQQQPMDGGFRDQFDMGRGYDDMPQNRWEGPPRQMDDFPNKRRRY